MKYFDGINNVNILKQKYRSLALENHPDKGGSTDLMQEINKQYQQALNNLRADGIINQQEVNIAEDIMEKINSIIHLSGITIEICGSWIWVSGLTMPVKDDLKSNGFYWASKKKMWYWRPANQKRSRRKTQSMEWIRANYGSKSPEVDAPGSLL